MKRPVLILSISLLCLFTFAHEFWLQPFKFLLKQGEQTSVNIYVGEDFTGEKPDVKKHSITKLMHYSAAGNEDYKMNIDTADGSIIHASFGTEGNHLIAFNNTNKFIELEAKKFNDYLLSEGLQSALTLRKQNNDTGKAGREMYQRCVKTLFQVGNKQDSSYAINTGMMLELIPLQNPYNIKNNGELKFRVLYNNLPLKDALVLVWNVIDNKVSHQKYQSNEAGEISFPVTKSGRWMVSTVRMVPYNNPAEADWQSYWGSYTFGYY